MRIRLRSRRTPTPAEICHPGEPLARQIEPVWVERFDLRDLLRSPPALQLLLTCNRPVNIVERLPVQQTLGLIFVRKSFDTVKFVLKDTFVQAACYADVESSRQAAHDVRDRKSTRLNSSHLGISYA